MALARAGTLALAAAMRRQSVTVSATVLLALSVPGAGSGMQAGSATWTARPVHVLEVPGGVESGTGSFGQVAGWRCRNPHSARDGNILQRLDWTLSTWTPDAALLLATESHEVAEGLTLPTALRAGVDGFRLRHSDRHVWYAYEDARELQTVFPPIGFERFIPLDGGDLLGLGRIPDGPIAGT